MGGIVISHAFTDIYGRIARFLNSWCESAETRRRFGRFKASHCLILLVTLGCRSGESIRNPRTDLVAAASLADVLTELGAAFESEGGAPIRLTTGASGVLCEQVLSGAPCDLFVPADPGYVDRLVRGSDVKTRLRAELAANRLVVVTSNVSGHRTAPSEDADGLREALRAFRRIAIANPEHAPAGARAKEALIALGMWDSLKDRIVFADDVRMAARYVADRATEGGIVYRTDARSFDLSLEIVAVVPASLHAPIRYEAVLGPEAKNVTDAERFLEFMLSDRAGKIWRDRGFETIDDSAR